MSRRANGEGSIYPYRNGFAAHVWIVTPKGRRQRKTVYGKTRPEVHDKWLRLHEQARRGPMVPVSPRLRDFLERWLEETVRPTLSPATTSNYEMFSRLYIVPDLGDRKLDKLMVRDVQVWVNTLRVRCQCCFQGKDAARPEPQCCALGACCHEVASDWTVHQAWRVLRGALTQAMREELVFRNVAALVRVPMPRSKKMPVWTVDEARRFLESARADGDPMYAGYVLLLTLGLRRGEMLGLAWEDVDLEQGEALIAWQVQRVDHSAAPAPHEDAVLGCAAATAGDRGAGTRAASGRGGQAAARGRRHVGRLRLGLHDPARRSGRPTQLPPRLQAEGREGRRAGRPHSLDSADLRQPARCPRRSPARRHGRPPPQPHRPHDGDLLPGLVDLHARCTEASRRRAVRVGIMTDHRREIPVDARLAGCALRPVPRVAACLALALLQYFSGVRTRKRP